MEGHVDFYGFDGNIADFIRGMMMMMMMMMMIVVMVVVVELDDGG